ncbi:hypothetical protein EBL85_13955 [Marichromatium sp. AB32]|nr:hypothetical protein EBL85_13955 [Marichromatium sp. AB32]
MSVPFRITADMAVGVMMLAPVSLVLEGGVGQALSAALHPDRDPLALGRPAAGRSACPCRLLAGLLACSNRRADTRKKGMIAAFSMHFDAMGRVPALAVRLVGMDSTRRKSRVYGFAV